MSINKPIKSSNAKYDGAMSSRQRLQITLNHKQPDRVSVDLGVTGQTGIGVEALTRLREAVLDDADYWVKVFEPLQMLGEVAPMLREKLSLDTTGVFGPIASRSS